MKRIGVVCGGSHAAVLIEAIRLQQAGEVVCVFDDDPSRLGDDIFGVPVIGPVSSLDHHRAALEFSSVVIGMANYNRRREQQELFAQMRGRGLDVLTVVHPSAFVSPTAQLGGGVFVGPGAVLHARAQIGDNVVINTGATVDHDAWIGPHVFVSPGVCMAGHVRIEQRAYVGPGAILGSRVRIGRDAVVGAGACVLRDVGSGAKVFGLPARPVAE